MLPTGRHGADGSCDDFPRLRYSDWTESNLVPTRSPRGSQKELKTMVIAATGVSLRLGEPQRRVPDPQLRCSNGRDVFYAL